MLHEVAAIQPPQVGWQVLLGPRSHHAVIKRKPTAKFCKHKATPSPLRGDGQTQLLCAMKVLQSWNLALQMCSPKTPLKSKIQPIQRSFLQAAWWVSASGSLQHSSRTRARERKPEAITNLEHLFMQLIFLKGKKAKNNNKKKQLTTAGGVWYNPHQMCPSFAIPPLVPPHHPLPQGSCLVVPVPLAAALGCCQLSGSLFLHIDKIVPIWYFSWV